MKRRNLSPFVLLGTALLITGCTPRSQGTQAAPPENSAPAPESPVTPSEASANAPTGTTATGAQLYQQSCKGCHGGKGEGVSGSGVALAEEAGEEADELRAVILKGKGKMPAFKGRLSEPQIAAIIEHLRTFGSRGEEKHHED